MMSTKLFLARQPSPVPEHSFSSHGESPFKGWEEKESSGTGLTSALNDTVMFCSVVWRYYRVSASLEERHLFLIQLESV